MNHLTPPKKKTERRRRRRRASPEVDVAARALGHFLGGVLQGMLARHVATAQHARRAAPLLNDGRTFDASFEVIAESKPSLVKTSPATSSPTKCITYEGDASLMPGWGCCACRAKDGFGTYNGKQRTHCKWCGHARCA